MKKKTKAIIKKRFLNFRSLSSLAICALLFGAVWQLNYHIHQNSVVADLKKEIAAIGVQNSDLESKLSQSNSLDDFDRYRVAEAENYEKVDIAGVRYVYVSGSNFAKR